MEPREWIIKGIYRKDKKNTKEEYKGCIGVRESKWIDPVTLGRANEGCENLFILMIFTRRWEKKRKEERDAIKI